MRHKERQNKGLCLSDQPLIIVQPDIMVICNENSLDGKRCNGAPDFIIEIVPPGNPEDDYIRKLYYYKNYVLILLSRSTSMMICLSTSQKLPK